MNTEIISGGHKFTVLPLEGGYLVLGQSGERAGLAYMSAEKLRETFPTVDFK